MKKVFKNKMVLIGTVIILSFLVLAVFAEIFSGYDPTAIVIEDALVAPSASHWLGTDQLGRDVFARLVFGARISLSIGFIAVGIATLIGVILGSLAGYYRGWVDSVIMRFVDIMLCFPVFFLLLAVIALLEPSIFNIMIIIGLTSWMGVARLIRAEILSLKEREFILSEYALGAGTARIILKHLIPNAIGPVLVSATLGIGAAILVESSLSFLGLGVQPPTASWGNMLIEAKSTLGVAWWLTVFPGVSILFTILGFNLIGEGLREVFGYNG
ncbi:MAG: ABC transporter permease [Candidatus Gygaella obscura]|nr:ABC transporter permease [Candidatus Gygaella obscura]